MESNYSGVKRRFLLSIPVLSIGLGIIAQYGLPGDLATFLLSLLGLLGIVFGIFWGFTLNRIGYGIVMTAYLYVFLARPFASIFPFLDTYSLFDHQGGRTGIRIDPGLRFKKAGPNTPLLESYLGTIEPKWVCQHHYSRRARFLRTHRAKTWLISFSPQLSNVLKLLPSDEARRTVLACLVDGDNCLRAHQSMLLGCLNEFGFPAGLDSPMWWNRHESLFYRENDPKRAVKLVRGWSRQVERLLASCSPKKDLSDLRIQYFVATYQEQGLHGGNLSFSREYQQSGEDVQGKQAPTINVDWWKCSQER